MKKVVSINELETFRFHDCKINDVEIADNNIIWCLDHIDVLNINSKNDNPTAMRTDEATICFEKYALESIIIRHFYMDRDEIKETISKNEIAEIQKLLNGGEIYECVLNKQRVAFEVLVNNTIDILELSLVYGRVCIEWNKFVSPSYFVGHENK